MLQRQIEEEAAWCFSAHNRDAIIKRLISKDWVYVGSGGYKIAYGKGDLVAKVGFCISDCEVYYRMRRMGLLRYMARAVFLSPRFILQRHVRLLSRAEMDSDIYAEQLAFLNERIKAAGCWVEDLDYGNVGVLNGQVKIIDCFLGKCGVAEWEEGNIGKGYVYV